MNIIICVLLVISIIISAAALVTGLKGANRATTLPCLTKKIDITAKRTDEALHNVSLQMQALTEKNYEQMLKINESLSANAEKAIAKNRRSDNRNAAKQRKKA
ncbi:MAG: hypothetical protein L6V88_00960 [Anaerotruncus sp.]|nr:MAG: hypothetical protein L6V88_00960 [Anaerotruncus sp.]